MLLTAVTNAQNLNLKDLYRQVDQEIEHFPEYVAQYEQQIAANRVEYKKASTLQERYRLALVLYEQYRAFQHRLVISSPERLSSVLLPVFTMRHWPFSVRSIRHNSIPSD